MAFFFYRFQHLSRRVASAGASSLGRRLCARRRAPTSRQGLLLNFHIVTYGRLVDEDDVVGFFHIRWNQYICTYK